MKKIITALFVLMSFSALASEKACSVEIENLMEATILYEKAPSINTSIDLESAKRSLEECIQKAQESCL